MNKKTLSTLIDFGKTYTGDPGSFVSTSGINWSDLQEEIGESNVVTLFDFNSNEEKVDFLISFMSYDEFKPGDRVCGFGRDAVVLAANRDMLWVRFQGGHEGLHHVSLFTLKTKVGDHVSGKVVQVLDNGNLVIEP